VSPQAAPARLRILIVDDHEVVRVGLASLIGDDPGFEVVASVGTAQEAEREAARLRPDIVVLDLRLPDRPGVDLVPRLKALAPGVRILALTSYGEDEAVIASVAAGVDAFLTKTAHSQALLDSLRRLGEGGSPLKEQVGDVLIRHLRQEYAGEGGRGVNLTARELEVAALVSEGLSNREIAERLFLSEKTVRNTVTSVLGKLGLRRRGQIIVAFRQGHLAGLEDRPPRPDAT
jgi:two-component system response regulator DevR